MLHMPNAKEISPTLRLIIEQFDEENQRPPSEDVSPLDQAPVFTEESIDGDASNTDMGSGVSGDGFAECGPSWDYDNGNDNFNYDDDRESVVDESTFPSSADSTCYQEVHCLFHFSFFLFYFSVVLRSEKLYSNLVEVSSIVGRRRVHASGYA